MAQEMRHPLSGNIYGVDEDGLVRVEKDGKVGRFHWDGSWVDGEIRSADPQLCLWIGGPQLPPGADSLLAMLSGDTPTTVASDDRTLANEPA